MSQDTRLNIALSHPDKALWELEEIAKWVDNDDKSPGALDIPTSTIEAIRAEVRPLGLRDDETLAEFIVRLNARANGLADFLLEVVGGVE